MIKNKISILAKAVREAYKSGQEDETMEPIILASREGIPTGRFKSGDYVIFYDIRGEREIELTKCLTDENFNFFPVEKDLRLNFVTMIEYQPGLKVKVAFPPEETIKDTLSEVISKNGFKQVKISESEKAVHVGYFFNGKRVEPFPGEERIVIPSPQNVRNYNEKPEMSSEEVSRTVIEKLKDEKYIFFMVNFANVDVVGHIEDENAVIKAVECVDYHLGKLVEEALNAGFTIIITADHGTVEEWLYPEGTINTGHTKNPVPFILINSNLKSKTSIKLKREGELIDVAPTVLFLLNLPKPDSMTGKNLIVEGESQFRKNDKNRVLMIILDGWGLREEKKGNLISKANTPNFDYLWKNYPTTKLRASGEAVGMPSGTVGNSESGHLHIGAGRRVYSDRLRIDKAIENGSFFKNKSLLWAMKGAKKDNKSLHLMGIVSFYSSHGTIKHLFALLKMAKNIGLKNVFIHSFLGRRGEKPESGAIYIDKVDKEARKLGVGKVVSIIGRYWALDREGNWDRVEKTYRMLVYGEGKHIINEF